MREFTDAERDYLCELLIRRHGELLHELHHTAARRFKDELKGEVELVEQLCNLLAPAHV